MAAPSSRKKAHIRFAVGSGFTLAELLITLAILGEITSFTIPKILVSQQKNTFNAAGKEMVATIASAYQTYKLTNTVTAATSVADLTQYLNYASIAPSGLVDSVTGSTSIDCATAGIQCLRFHNGGTLVHYGTNVTFGGTSNINALYFQFDPDGKYSGTTNGPGKAVAFYLYTNGRVTDGSQVDAVQIYNWGSLDYWTGGNPNDKPDWFSW